LCVTAAVIEHKTETPVIDVGSIVVSIVGSIIIIIVFAIIVIGIVKYWCIPECRGKVNSLRKRYDKPSLSSVNSPRF